MKYVEELNHMYDEYYCKSNGHCKYWEQCKEGLSEESYPCKFYSDRVKVGSRYGTDPAVPKIVFVGLEGVHDGFQNQCIPVIDLSDSISVPSMTASNPHYRGVRYVLAYLMARYRSNENDIPKDASIEALEAVQDSRYLDLFCLTNVFKCAFGDGKTGLPHTKSMQEHCIEILIKEIKILKPDVLVIQVVTGRPPKLWKMLKKDFLATKKPLARAERNTNTSVYQFIQDGRPFYCVWTYHGNGGPYYRKEGGVFANNLKYIQNELNPVLNVTIQHLKADRGCYQRKK